MVFCKNFHTWKCVACCWATNFKTINQWFLRIQNEVKSPPNKKGYSLGIALFYAVL